MNRAKNLCAKIVLLASSAILIPTHTWAIPQYGIGTAPASPATSDVVPAPFDVTIPLGISIIDGNYAIDVTDLSIGGLDLVRTSQQASPSVPDKATFGFHMTSNFDIYLARTVVLESTTGYSETVLDETSTQFYYPMFYESKLQDGQVIMPSRFHEIVHIGNSASGVYTENDVSVVYSVGNTGPYPTNTDALSGILTDMANPQSIDYQYIDKDGNIYIFNSGVSANTTGGGGGTSPSSGRVSSITYANGTIRTFSYDSNGNLKLVTDSTGYAILFDIGSNGYPSDACGIDLSQTYVSTSSSCSGQSLVVKYGYSYTSISGTTDNYYTLNSITDVLGNVTTYGYGTLLAGQTDQSGYVTCIQPPGYSSCKTQISSYGTTPNFLRTETLADGTSWTIDPYDEDGNSGEVENQADPVGSASVTDALNQTTSYTFIGQSPSSVTDPNGNTTSYTWAGSVLREFGVVQGAATGSLMLSATYPEGNSYQAYYFGPFNAVTEEDWIPKPNSPLSTRKIKYTYGPPTSGIGMTTASLSGNQTFQNAAKPLSKTDENGNETDWTYAAFGGTLSEMGPAPTTGAARPLKLYTYVQKSAYILNSSGTLASTNKPIWLPSTETICQTTAGSNTATCDSSAPQEVTTYLYGADGTADNLLVRGKQVSGGGVTLLTCYSYDQYSHKISETAPNALLTSCP